MSALAKKKPGNKGLGRGLDALLGTGPGPENSDPAPGKRELPTAFLRPAKDQPRQHFDEGAIDELAQSILSRGLLQPILVRPLGDDDYEIVAGERRWRAAQKAKLHNVPVIIRTLSDDEANEIALIENVQRVDLNPIEEAAAYKRLIKTHNRTQDEIAKAVGKSRSHIANMMRLLKLPKDAREALASGALTAGHARAILGASDPGAMCRQVLRDGLSVRQTEALVQRSNEAAGKPKRRGKTDGKGQPKDADTRALERDLSAALGLDVAIEHNARGGSLTVHYLDLDQLDDICRRLMGAGV